MLRISPEMKQASHLSHAQELSIRNPRSSEMDHHSAQMLWCSNKKTLVTGKKEQIISKAKRGSNTKAKKKKSNYSPLSPPPKAVSNFLSKVNFDSSTYFYKVNPVIENDDEAILKSNNCQEERKTDLHLLIAALMDDKGPWLNKEKK